MKHTIVVICLAFVATFAQAQRVGLEANRVLFQGYGSTAITPELNTVGLSYSRKIISLLGIHVAASLNYGDSKIFGTPVTNHGFTETISQFGANARVEWRPLYGFIVHPIVAYSFGFAQMQKSISNGTTDLVKTANYLPSGLVLGVGAKLFGIRFDFTSQLIKSGNISLPVYSSDNADINKAYANTKIPLSLRNYTLRVSFPINTKEKQIVGKMKN